MTATAVDLFSGAGGMSAGLAQAGFDVRAAFDNWGPAVLTYRANFSHPIYERDVASLTGNELAELTGVPVGELDLLAGGPPCQGFSIQRIGEDIDDRNDLALQFVRLVAEYQPRTFLIENVPGILGSRGKVTMAAMHSRLALAGYDYSINRINAAEYGVAQSRKRVLILGWRIGEEPLLLGPRALATPVSVSMALSGLPAPVPIASESSDPLHVTSKLSALNKERLTHIPPGGGFEDLPMELRANCHKVGAAVIGHRSVYGRLHPDRPAGVITARFDSFTRGRFAHPSEDRNITLREGARLQSFDDDFVFLGNREQIAAQIGNAVPPMVAKAVGTRVLNHIQAGLFAGHGDSEASIA